MTTNFWQPRGDFLTDITSQLLLVGCVFVRTFAVIRILNKLCKVCNQPFVRVLFCCIIHFQILLLGAYYFKSLPEEAFLYYNETMGYETFTRSPEDLFTFSGKERSMEELLDTGIHKVLLPWRLKGDVTVAMASCNRLSTHPPGDRHKCHKFVLAEVTSTSGSYGTTELCWRHITSPCSELLHWYQ